MQNKLKIIFISGSLEPGKDGVGDYVRRMASELIIQGHDVRGVGIYDPHVSAVTQQAEDFVVYRIPSTLAEAERITLAKRFVEDFNPDWISLQFVIFAFHDKGLPFTLSKHLKTLGKHIKWHIMFHELYVGMYKDATLRHKIWGLVQRMIVKKLLRRLKPKAISTQNSVYQTILRQDGIPSFHLPLFGNIRQSTVRDEQRQPLLSSSVINIVSFGTIHPDSLIEAFAQEIAEFGRSNQLDFRLILIGRSGGHQDDFTRIWESHGLQTEILGEQPEDIISQTLSKGSFGISTTKYAMIEKSGTVAAMIEHSLPVLCIAKLWQRKGIENLKSPQGIIQYHEGELKSAIDRMAEVVFTPQSSGEIAAALVDYLRKTD